MNLTHLSVEALTQLLREAQAAHHEFEETLGQPDENWARWYAEYILNQLEIDDIDHPTKVLPRPAYPAVTSTD